MKIIDNINVTVPNPRSTYAGALKSTIENYETNRRKRIKILLMTILFSPLFVIGLSAILFLVVALSGYPIRIIDSLLLGFIVTLWGTLTITFIYLTDLSRSKPRLGQLNYVCTSNQNRLSVARVSRGHDLQSVIWKTIDDTYRMSMEEALIEGDVFEEAYSHILKEINSLQRSDGKEPSFIVGRITGDSAYRGQLFVSIKLPKHYPHFFIDYDRSRVSLQSENFLKKLSSDQRYDLEGNFADYFTMYAASASDARFATYALPPNIMQKIMKITPRGDIEVIDDNLHLIWDPHDKTEAWGPAINEMFYVLNTIASNIYEQVTKYRFDSNTQQQAVKNKLQFSLAGKVYNYVRDARVTDHNRSGGVEKSWQFWVAVIIAILFWGLIAVIYAALGIDPSP